MELCKLAGVSRSGYYRWIAASNQRAIREASDYQDFLLIKEAYDYRGYAKGSRGICMRLKRMGITMNRKKVQRLMRKYNLCCPIRKANPYRRIHHRVDADSTLICTGHKMPVSFQSLFRPRPLPAKANSRTASSLCVSFAIISPLVFFS